jgi:phosphatidylglycerol---prolipoprotein diacylglyceryl transferase
VHPFIFQGEIYREIMIRIPSFGFFVLLGILFGSGYALFRFRQSRLEFIAFAALWGFTIGFGFLGAILAGMIFSQLDFFPSGSPLTGEFTLAWQGGILAGTLAYIWMLRNLRLPIVRSLDVIVPPVFLGLAIGRIGCLLGGCCYGNPTFFPWGIIYPDLHLSRDLFGSLPLHPVPAYSIILALFIVLLAKILNGKNPDGFVFMSCLTLYMFGRLGLERFRGDHGCLAVGMTSQQIFSVFSILLLLIWYFRFQRCRIEPTQKGGIEK